MPLADVACPHCGNGTRVNVAALPPNATSARGASTPCTSCGGKITVWSRTDGTHTVSDTAKSSGFGTVLATLAIGALILGAGSSGKK